MPPRHLPPSRPHGNNLLRIIGGEWRSRRLPFADVPGLRPTPDRVRETLFNWLQGRTPGSRCLDLFAGSGALGFEALSRGAQDVVMVEKHPAAAAVLRENIALLGAQHATLIHDDAFRYLQRETAAFDLVFLDPPFRQNLLGPVLESLFSRSLLKPNGMIYLEQESGADTGFARFGLEVHRVTQAGQAQGFLLFVNNQ